MTLQVGENTLSADFSFYQQRATGTLHVKRLSRRERTIRSGKRGCIALACTAVAVVIPPHIVWLLLGLLVVPSLALFTFRQEYLLLDGSGECPACKAQIQLQPGAVQWPIIQNCHSCHRELEIRSGDDIAL